MSHQPSLDNSSRKKAFNNWLKSQSNIKFNPDQVIRIFDEVSSFAMEHGIAKKSIWEMDSRVEFSNFENKISSMRLFRINLRKESKLFSKISRYYKVFLDSPQAKHLEDNTTSSNISVEVTHLAVNEGNQNDTPSAELKTDVFITPYMRLSQKLFEISKAYKDQGLISFEKIMDISGSEDCESARKILDTSSWAYKYSEDYYSFSKAVNPSVESKTELSNDVNTLLEGEEFAPLRSALSNQSITTIDQLKTLKLWPFMNRYNLYSIGQRQAVFSKVNALLYPEADLDKTQAYVLHVGGEEYLGKTPSESFLQFCNYEFKRHPLQFKLLVGKKMSDSQDIPIRMQNSIVDLIEIPGLHAYIRPDLSIQEVVNYTGWIQSKCGDNSGAISMSEPEASAQPHISSDNDKTTPAEASAPDTIHSISNDVDTSAYDYDCGARIEQYVLKADTSGASYSDIKNAFPITMVAAKRYVASSVHIVEIKGRLYHEEALIDFEEGSYKIEEIIEKLMQKNNGYVSSAQLYDYARTDMNMFLTDNDMNDERSVYDIARHLFEKVGYHNKHFSFYGNNHISRIDHPVTCNLDVIKKYAEDRGGLFSFDELTQYLDSIGVGSSNLRAQMKIPNEPIFFYYVEGLLICAENMHIDATWKSEVKNALNDLFSDVGEYIIFRSIPKNWFDRLPPLPYGCPWTPLLLQSVLRCYSKELGASTIPAMAGQSLETLHAMLVKKDSQIQGFGDVVIAFLMDSNVKQRHFEAEELRRTLVDAGILQGNELIWNMPKALGNDERFAWDASGSNVTVEV